MSHESEQNDNQQRLADHYARTVPSRPGVVRQTGLLVPVLRGNVNQTRTSLEAARGLFKATGGNWKERLILSVTGLRGRYVMVLKENDDTLIVQAWNGSGKVGDTFKISKGLGLRRYDYDGLSYGGYAFAYVDAHTRTATPTAGGSPVTQKITPDYLDATNNLLISLSGVEGWDANIEGTDEIDGNFSAGRTWAVPQ